MSDPSMYGDYYFCVKTPQSKDGEIYVKADYVRLDRGVLLFCRRDKDDGQERVNLALAPDQWHSVYAASVIDGHAVAVEHWKGEVVERR